MLGDDVPEIDAAIFRGRRIYQELPAPAINHINGRDNTALRTALINNTFSLPSGSDPIAELIKTYIQLGKRVHNLENKYATCNKFLKKKRRDCKRKNKRNGVDESSFLMSCSKKEEEEEEEEEKDTINMNEPARFKQLKIEVVTYGNQCYGYDFVLSCCLPASEGAGRRSGTTSLRALSDVSRRGAPRRRLASHPCTRRTFSEDEN
ncbi:hypothetical protein C0J52_00935 [Blattella germanica]|nr:hypothetical protein C0J52_00935 [Blattella germanica]